MENQEQSFTPQAEIDAIVENLRQVNEWPGADASVTDRRTMLQRRLTLMAMGVELPVISL